jgi:nucleotide-binding universal stress UspA family protein
VDVLPGSAAEAIVFLAHSQDMDLIAMATHGRGGLGRWLMGSVSDKVVASADTAVLVVRARPQDQMAPGGISRLVVPLDGSDLSERAVPVAERVALGTGAPLLLVRVVPTPLTAFSAFGPGVEVLAASQLLQHADREAEAYLATWQDRLRQRGLAVETAVRRGPPADEVLHVVSEQRDGLLVMGTHGRTGPGRYVLGSVADKLVHSASCPIILVR